MSKPYDALPVLQVALSGGTGEYELRKNETVAALQKEFPDLKKGFGGFGVVQDICGKKLEIKLYSEKWSKSNLYRDYPINQAFIKGRQNIIKPFKVNSFAEYAGDNLLNGLGEGIGIIEDYRDKTVGYGSNVIVTGKELIGKRLKKQVLKCDFEIKGEFLKEL